MSMSVHVDEQTGAVTVTWHDVDDAIQVAHVLVAAGRGPDGEIYDQGFYDDGWTIIDAAVSWCLEHPRRSPC